MQGLAASAMWLRTQGYGTTSLIGLATAPNRVQGHMWCVAAVFKSPTVSVLRLLGVSSTRSAAWLSGPWNVFRSKPDVCMPGVRTMIVLRTVPCGQFVSELPVQGNWWRLLQSVHMSKTYNVMSELPGTSIHMCSIVVCHGLLYKPEGANPQALFLQPARGMCCWGRSVGSRALRCHRGARGLTYGPS